MKRLFKMGLIIFWLFLIFIFSSQIGYDSSRTSQLVISVFNILGINVNSILGEIATTIVRKGAHVFEYFVLSMLVFSYLSDKYSTTFSSLVSILFSFLYSITDEFHQSFVPGRAGSPIDVLIDTSGAILGIGLINIMIFIRKKLENYA